METLTQQIGNLTTASSLETSLDILLLQMTDFLHNPQSGIASECWFKRYEGTFTVDLADKDNKTKVRLILRKLGPVGHMPYGNFVFPDQTLNRAFDETNKSMKIVLVIHLRCLILHTNV